VIGFYFSPSNISMLEGPGLGLELVTDVGFDNAGLWTAGTGWTVAGGKATKVAGTGSFLSLTGSVVVPGIFYQVVVVVDSRSAGAVLPNIGNVDGSPGITAAGTYTYLIQATSTISTGAAGINIFGNAAFAGVFDSISVKRLS